MNKLALIISASIGAMGCYLVSAQDKSAVAAVEQKAEPAAIYGAYELKLPNGAIRKRFITNGRWAITQSDPETGVMIFHHGGAYVFDGVNYIEFVDYAADSTKDLIGNRHKFIITVKKGSIHMQCVDNPWDEEWVRVKDESVQASVDLSIPTVPAEKVK